MTINSSSQVSPFALEKDLLPCVAAYIYAQNPQRYMPHDRGVYYQSLKQLESIACLVEGRRRKKKKSLGSTSPMEVFNVSMFVDSKTQNIKTLTPEKIQTLASNYDYSSDYELSWNELQAALKEIYYHHGAYWGRGYIHELKCSVCENIFYAKYPYAKYCNYWCQVDRYIERRRELHGFKRWKGPCQYCNKEFVSSRVHARYCSDSHRVLACLARKKGTEERTYG
jgi:hypothetical protein